MTEILVYCDDPAHEMKRAKVAEFVKSCDACDLMACQRQGGSREHDCSWGLRLGNPGLDDAEPRRQVRGVVTTSSGEYTESDMAWRYRLPCPLCGLNVTAAESTLIPLFDTLKNAGVSSITLAALAARVTSK